RQSYLTDAEESQKAYEEKRQAIINGSKEQESERQEKIRLLSSQLSELEYQKKEVINFNASVDAAIKHNNNLIEDQKLNKEKIQNSKNKIEQLKLALDAAKQYNSIKLKKQSAQISKYLDKVDISFEKLTKDGELKDDFKINYEGKEFNKLSNAEKIKAGLEIANLLINLQNLHFPIFVDNAESINEVPELDTQMIQAKVTTDNEVKVEVIE
ncbi:DNA repair protein, partial [Clostridium butyricum]